MSCNGSALPTITLMPKLPSRQAQRSARARERIVQAAVTVFALKGYAAASMDDVRLAAGCSKGGLYHHFPGKGALLAAAVDGLAELADQLPPDSAEPAAALARARLLVELWGEVARDRSLRERLARRYAERRGPEAPLADPVSEMLRLGGVVRLITQASATDPVEAARRLGIGRAA